MSIRLRILLVAVMAVFSVGAGFYGEFSSQQRVISSLKVSRTLIVDAQTLSSAIHSLQKERGLSAGFLAEQNNRNKDLLHDQHRQTDSTIKALATVLLNAYLPSGLANKLEETRLTVLSGQAVWADIEGFYGDNIKALLDAIALGSRQQGATQIAVKLSPLVHLAVSRESLGQIRAKMNRVYTVGSVDEDQIVEISTQYGAFKERLRLFRRDAPPFLLRAYEERFKSQVFNSLTVQIETLLRQRTPLHSRTASLWWDEATLVIDAMKSIEDLGFFNLQKDIDHQITTEQDKILTYGIVAGILTLMVAGLAVFAVARVLKALSVLIATLDRVMRQQDFGVRIKENSKDEFGAIGMGLNELLEYTDKIVKQKDLLAATDILTGLKNRRSFTDYAKNEMARAKRYEGDLSLILCDIDHFKSVNDTYGHNVGDDALRAFAGLFDKIIRNSDIPARWGGEEFVVLAPETDVEQAELLAEKLRRATEQMEFPHIPRITCSFGVAQWKAGESFEDLCVRADEALYAAKVAGRNRVNVHRDKAA